MHQKFRALQPTLWADHWSLLFAGRERLGHSQCASANAFVAYFIFIRPHFRTQGKLTTDCDGSVEHRKWQEPAGTLLMALTAYIPKVVIGTHFHTQNAIRPRNNFHPQIASCDELLCLGVRRVGCLAVILNKFCGFSSLRTVPWNLRLRHWQGQQLNSEETMTWFCSGCFLILQHKSSLEETNPSSTVTRCIRLFQCLLLNGMQKLSNGANSVFWFSRTGFCILYRDVFTFSTSLRSATKEPCVFYEQMANRRSSASLGLWTLSRCCSRQ